MFINVFFYFVRGACAIAGPKRGEVIITGGKHTMSRATVYNESGWTGTELEDLNVGRQFHGCSAYELDVETVGNTHCEGYLQKLLFLQYFLVTGGFDGSSYLDSTEVFTGVSWRLMASLPRKMRHLRAANIDNRVILTGQI